MPLPAPELYERVKEGEAPLVGEKGSGMENPAVPLTAFTENFSSMPLIAPPPLGKDIEGTSIALDLVFPPSVLRKVLGGVIRRLLLHLIKPFKVLFLLFLIYVIRIDKTNVVLKTSVTVFSLQS